MRILFLCQFNSIRSPMAEGLLAKNHPSWEVESAGLAAGGLDDLMVAVMRERGVDMKAHESCMLDEIEGHVDVAVALTGAAGEAADAYFADTDTVVETWELPDPTGGYLDVRSMMNDYRAVRDNLEQRLAHRFGGSR